MELEEMIKDLETLKAFFEERSGAYPVSLEYAIKQLSNQRHEREGMTRREKMIVSAYTGVLMVPMEEFHEWLEDYLGYPVWTHEFALRDFWDDLHVRTSKEFMEICQTNDNGTTSPSDMDMGESMKGIM